MKKLITLLFLIPFVVLSQLPYTWTAGVNPGWTSSNSVLAWKPGCTVVTTNCTGNYASNINSTYTSPIINAGCSSASTVNITFTASGNAEYSWDFLFIEYSLNGGVTWINPYGVGVGWTGNFGGGSTIPPITAPTSTTLMVRFNFQSDGSFNYSGYKITDLDIGCNTVLPLELFSFTGENVGKSNNLYWSTSSENNNDYFTLERSTDGINWTVINIQQSGGNSTEQQDYSFNDWSYITNVINYYRLSQTDLEGHSEIFDIVSIDNKLKKDGYIIKTVNMIGQEIDSNKPTCGVVFDVYDNGSVKQRMLKSE